MRSGSRSLICMLGHPRVLEVGAADAHRRDVARRDGRIVGAAAFEPLYGPAAELAVALEDPADLHLARRLVAAVARLAHAEGLHTVHVAVQPGQDAAVATVLGAPIIDGRAVLPAAALAGSVATTEHDEQGARMTGLRLGRILDP